MPWYDIVWTDEIEEYIGQHGLELDDVRHVLENFDSEDVSRSSGRPIRFGDIPDGREIAVVFEWIDDVTLCPITAYEV
jgi:uncharacterized DUF497 family protein